MSSPPHTLVVPSLWPYLDELGSTKQYLAWVVAMYSVGEAVGAIAFGSLGSKQSTRSVMVLATVWGGVGSVLYVAAPLSRSRGPSGVLVGRFLQVCLLPSPGLRSLDISFGLTCVSLLVSSL